VHWNRVGSARDEDGKEEAKREEKSNDEATFPCAKRTMNYCAAFAVADHMQGHVAANLNKWLYRHASQRQPLVIRFCI